MKYRMTCENCGNEIIFSENEEYVVCEECRKRYKNPKYEEIQDIEDIKDLSKNLNNIRQNKKPEMDTDRKKNKITLYSIVGAVVAIVIVLILCCSIPISVDRTDTRKNISNAWSSTTSRDEITMVLSMKEDPYKEDMEYMIDGKTVISFDKDGDFYYKLEYKTGATGAEEEVGEYIDYTYIDASERMIYFYSLSHIYIDGQLADSKYDGYGIESMECAKISQISINEYRKKFKDYMSYDYDWGSFTKSYRRGIFYTTEFESKNTATSEYENTTITTIKVKYTKNFLTKQTIIEENKYSTSTMTYKFSKQFKKLKFDKSQFEEVEI